ncbi:hypothetical protein [Pelomonas sp. KK5]|uniref:hypothetical protein n=1 Tax=Pelomonas sp. KK5 TaxID=1855730 RepID=UPI00117F74E3|nr:hypothetical protein [Pelomonas sp. KK5]
MRNFDLLLGLLLLAVGLPVFAGPDSDFIEDAKSFPKFVMPALRTSQETTAEWYDDHRIIMSVRSLPSGWTAAEHELSRVILLDTEDGHVEQTPYEGELLCYSRDRMTLRHHWRIGGAYSDRANPGNIFESGVFGGRLDRIEWPRLSFLNPATCEVLPHSKKLDSGMVVMDQPLTPGHPTIRLERLWPGNSINGSHFLLIDAAGNTLTDVSTDWYSTPLPHNSTYMPWLGSHLLWRGYNYSPLVVNKAGEVSEQKVPRKILEWSRTFRLDGVGRMTRAGMAWVLTVTSSSAVRGIYLEEEDGALRRIENGAVAGWIRVSPDGCKLRYSRTRFGFEEKRTVEEMAKTRQWVVVDVCAGKR